MLENTDGAIRNGQSRETDNIGYTRRRKTKQKYNRNTTMRTQTQIISTRHERFYKQLEVKTNLTSFICGKSYSCLLCTCIPSINIKLNQIKFKIQDMTVPGNAKKHIVSGISVIFSVLENIKKKSEDTKGVFIIRKSKKNIYNIMAKLKAQKEKQRFRKDYTEN
jgi:hypothetical protein